MSEIVKHEIEVWVNTDNLREFEGTYIRMAEVFLSNDDREVRKDLKKAKLILECEIREPKIEITPSMLRKSCENCIDDGDEVFEKLSYDLFYDCFLNPRNKQPETGNKG